LLIVCLKQSSNKSLHYNRRYRLSWVDTTRN